MKIPLIFAKRYKNIDKRILYWKILQKRTSRKISKLIKSLVFHCVFDKIIETLQEEGQVFVPRIGWFYLKAIGSAGKVSPIRVLCIETTRTFRDHVRGSRYMEIEMT